MRHVIFFDKKMPLTSATFDEHRESGFPWASKFSSSRCIAFSRSFSCGSFWQQWWERPGGNAWDGKGVCVCDLKYLYICIYNIHIEIYIYMCMRVCCQPIEEIQRQCSVGSCFWCRLSTCYNHGTLGSSRTEAFHSVVMPLVTLLRVWLPWSFLQNLSDSTRASN